MSWFSDLVKQGLGITNSQKALQWVGQNAPQVAQTVLKAEPVAQQVVQRAQNLYPQITLPRVQTPSYLPSTIKFLNEVANPVNIGLGLTEGLLNAPRKYIGGITNTGINIADSLNDKRVPLTRYAADLAQVAEPILDVGTLGFGGSLFKQGAKQLAKPVVKQTFKGLAGNIAKEGLKLSAEGAGFGAGYGSLTGLQESRNKSVDEMLATTMQRAKEGMTMGAIAGPIAGGTLKVAGKAAGKAISYLKKNPTKAGFANFGEDVLARTKKEIKPKGNLADVMPTMDTVLKRTNKTLEAKVYPQEKPSIPYTPSDTFHPDLKTTVLLDKIHRAISKQGEKTFDVTKTGKALEYYAQKLGNTELETAYTESLKFPKDKSLTAFWNSLKTKAKAIGEADFDAWQEAVGSQEPPVGLLPKKKTMKTMLEKPKSIVQEVQPSGVGGEIKTPKIEEPKKIWVGNDVITTRDPETGDLITNFKAKYIESKGETPVQPKTKPVEVNTSPQMTQPSVVQPKQKGNKYLTTEQIDIEERTVRKHLEQWAAEKKEGESAGTAVATPFIDVPEKLRDEVIQTREKTASNPSPKAVQVANAVGVVFDKLHKISQKLGLDVNFRENFFTHIWDEASIDRLVRDKVMGRSLSGEPYFLKGQHLTWEEGLKMGLTPKYKTIAQIIEAYTQKMYKAIANKRLVNRLKKNNLAYDYQAGSQYKPVSINGYKNELDGSNVVYLSRKAADLMTKVFNIKEPTAVWEKGLEKTAKFGKKATEIILSGGYRNINAMGIGKLLFKELPSGNFKAVQRFLQTLSSKGEKQIYSDIARDVLKYQQWGIDLHVGKQKVVDAISNKNISRSLPEKLQKAFKDNMESPTFDYFIPATEVDFARSIEKQARAKGFNESQVRGIVKRAMQNKYDIGSSLNFLLQNRNLQNALDTVFFAKTLRKSTIMTNLVGNIKALRHPLALENQGNIRGMIGGLIGLSILNGINKASTGRNMWENPDGWNHAYIKYGKDKDGNDQYFRLNTSTIEWTWAKQLADMASGVASGNTDKVLQTGKQTLQFGLKTVVDLVTNTDWKMDKIWNKSDTMTQRLKKVGTNVLNQNLHPVAKAVMTFFQKPDDEQRWAKLIGDAGEFPGTFKTEKQYKTATYYKNEQDIIDKLSPEAKTAYEQLKRKGTDFYAEQRDKVSDAYLLLNNPEVMKAQRDIAILTAKKNNQPLDPLWNLTDEQLKKYYQIQGLTNNGDAQKAMKKAEADWYEPLKIARGSFFDELVNTGVMKEKDTGYPEETNIIKQLKNEYYALPLGTGQRTRYAAAHPELVDYWNKVAAYYDKVGESFGLPKSSTTYQYGSSGISKYLKKNKIYVPSSIKQKNKGRITSALKAMNSKKVTKMKTVKSILSTIKKPKARKSLKISIVKKPIFPKPNYRIR